MFVAFGAMITSLGLAGLLLPSVRLVHAWEEPADDRREETVRGVTRNRSSQPDGCLQGIVPGVLVACAGAGMCQEWRVPWEVGWVECLTTYICCSQMATRYRGL